MKRLLIASLSAGISAASVGHAATVSSLAVADFSVAGQSLFGSGGSAGFDGSVGVGSSTSTFQFSASTGANTGSVNSSASIGVIAGFDDAQSVGIGTVSLSFGSASASFSTALGAYMDVTATVRTPRIPILIGPDIPAASIPFNLVDEDYFLDASESDLTYSFGQALTDTDSVSLPGAGAGVGITVEANPNVDQSSTLIIDSMVGMITAVNRATGTTLTDILMFDGGLESFDFNFVEAGLWDISLLGLNLISSFDSTFGLSATFSGGVEIGLGCGNPATNSDNSIACLFDAGLSTTTPTVDLLPISPFALDYNEVSLLRLGTIAVSAAPTGPVPVPIPATLPLLASVFGFGIWAGGRRTRRA